MSVPVAALVNVDETDMTDQIKNKPTSTRFRPKKTQAAKPVEGYLRVTCPHCGGSMRTIYSEQLTPMIQERRVTCKNDECMATYKAQVHLYQVINQPIASTLNTLTEPTQTDI